MWHAAVPGMGRFTRHIAGMMVIKKYFCVNLLKYWYNILTGKSASKIGGLRMSVENAILTVHGMSCSHCESSIKKAVGALNGVISVMVDLGSKKVSVEFDQGKVSVDTIKATIEDQGYDVR